MNITRFFLNSRMALGTQFEITFHGVCVQNKHITS